MTYTGKVVRTDHVSVGHAPVRVARVAVVDAVRRERLGGDALVRGIERGAPRARARTSASSRESPRTPETRSTSPRMSASTATVPPIHQPLDTVLPHALMSWSCS